MRQTVEILLNLIEELKSQVKDLRSENQRLRDENNRLKGEQRNRILEAAAIAFYHYQTDWPVVQSIWEGARGLRVALANTGASFNASPRSDINSSHSDWGTWTLRVRPPLL